MHDLQLLAIAGVLSVALSAFIMSAHWSWTSLLSRTPPTPRAKVWLQYADRQDLLSKPASQLYAVYRLCSEHFEPQCFMDPGRTKLKKTALPSAPPLTRWQMMIAQGKLFEKCVCTQLSKVVFFCTNSVHCVVTFWLV